MPRYNTDENGLTPKEAAFVREYLVCLEGKQAAEKAGYSMHTAKVKGYALLQLPRIAAAVAKGKAERAERTEITADMVLKRWWEIANANPNELIQFRRTCCRFCHGVGHAFQWKDEAEWGRAVAAALAKAGEDGKAQMPTNEGGYGFDTTLDPVETCPDCDGEGIGNVHAEDTRKLSSSALALYAGVKATKDGFEIKMQDQGAALANVAKHLGMFTEKIEVASVESFEGMTPEQKRERAIALAKELGLGRIARSD